MNRREFLATPAATALAAPAPKERRLALNEDNSHFFSSRAGKPLDRETVAAWVDQYANTQISELFLCPNSMRVSYDSKVWDPIWRNYDPNGPDDQPLLASLTPEGRTSARRWIHTAWDLSHRGIDVYSTWIARSRKQGLSPILSVRMNDIHNVDDEKAFIHSEFWRSNPQFRRVPYRFNSWFDRAFDYSHAEVREYHRKLIAELLERYDADGIELDWMRFGLHFRPGREQAGAALLTQWVRDLRQLTRKAEQRRGHRIQLLTRVASRPETSRRIGIDAVSWARQSLIDGITISPFFQTIETDMPVETWRELVPVPVSAGIELNVRPYPDYKPIQTNSLETVRGAAASFLDRGAHRVYLFNYMDSETAMADLGDYPTVLRECGSLSTLAGKPRRHILTYADTWAPGETRPKPLPVDTAANRWLEFRLPTGPAASSAQVRIAAEGAVFNEVRLNGDICTSAGKVEVRAPKPAQPFLAFTAPNGTLRGDNVIELQTRSSGRIHWVEVAIS